MNMAVTCEKCSCEQVSLMGFGGSRSIGLISHYRCDKCGHTFDVKDNAGDKEDDAAN